MKRKYYSPLSPILIRTCMLFSMYASFRWARGKNYVRKTTALIIIFSLLSTVLGFYIPYLFLLPLGPLPFLSFPFYDLWAERRLILPQPFEFSYEVGCYDICFLTTPLFQFVPQGPVTGELSPGEGWVQVDSYRVVLFDMEIGAIPYSLGLFFPLFLFFIVVNALGALLGFLISKIRITEKTKLGSNAFLGSVALGIIILAYGIWLFTRGETFQLGHWSKYYYSHGPSCLSLGAIACVIFGISWLITILLDRIIFNPFSHIYNYFTQP